MRAPSKTALCYGRKGGRLIPWEKPLGRASAGAPRGRDNWLPAPVDELFTELEEYLLAMVALGPCCWVDPESRLAVGLIRMASCRQVSVSGRPTRPDPVRSGPVG
jgi:hypothetical protein